MFVKNCSYKNCTRDFRYSSLKSKPFLVKIERPNKHIKLIMEKCKRWVATCGDPSLFEKLKIRTYYICSKHFVGGKGPTTEFPDPLPQEQPIWCENINGNSLPSSECSARASIIVKNDPEEINNSWAGTTKSPGEETKDDLSKGPGQIFGSLETSNTLKTYSGKRKRSSDEMKQPKKIAVESIKTEQAESILPEETLVQVQTPVILSSQCEDVENISTPNVTLSMLTEELMEKENYRKWIKNWYFSCTKDGLAFHKLQDSAVTTMATISNTLEVSIKVYNRDLSSHHSAKKNFPKTVYSTNDVMDVLSSLNDKWKLCCGHSGKHIVEAGKNSPKGGIYIWESSAIHSDHCQLLIPIKTRGMPTCRPCKNIRRRLRMRSNYHMKKDTVSVSFSKFTKTTCLSLEKVQKKVQSLNNEKANIRRKLKRRNKAAGLIFKEGV